MEQRQLGKSVARPLNEQHGNSDVREVRAALIGGLGGRMQGETQEDQATDAGQRNCRLGLRSHASAEGFPAGDERQRREQGAGSGDGGAHRGMTKGRGIRPPAAALHVRKLIPQGRDLKRGHLVRERFHEGMPHSRACAMRNDEARGGAARGGQQPGNASCGVDLDHDGLGDGGYHGKEYNGRMMHPWSMVARKDVPQDALLLSAANAALKAHNDGLRKCRQHRYIVAMGGVPGELRELTAQHCIRRQTMATKSASPGKKSTKRKAAASELSDGAVMVVLESKSVDADTRRRLVAAEAYFLAERRGFAAGNELEDWVAAEAAVDSRLQQMQVA